MSTKEADEPNKVIVISGIYPISPLAERQFLVNDAKSRKLATEVFPLLLSQQEQIGKTNPLILSLLCVIAALLIIFSMLVLYTTHSQFKQRKSLH